MIRFVVSNQRGGAGKTTTSITLARCLAEKGMNVLLVDADSQASIGNVLLLKQEFSLYDALVDGVSVKNCVVEAFPGLHVICGDRRTNRAQDLITTQIARELYFEQIFSSQDDCYDAVIIDTAPSMSLFQTCAMMYAKQVLVPVSMDTLSVQGAMASMQAARSLNDMFKRKPEVSIAGLLPVMVDRRLQMTDVVLNTVEKVSREDGVALLPAIRTDTSVVKAARHKKFLADYDPKSKALEDYRNTTLRIIELQGLTNSEESSTQVEVSPAEN